MPPPYPPVGRCIYCESPTYSDKHPTGKFGDEHIIPLGLGGTVLLRDACCKACERETSQIEEHCIRHMFPAARLHLGLRGRKSGRVPNAGPFTNSMARPVKIPAEAHPGYLVDYTFPYPAYLAGRRQIDPKSMSRVHIRQIVSDFEMRVQRLGGRIQIVLGAEGGVEMFARLLAKIAHVYTVAELGLTGFEPWLIPIVLGGKSEFDLYDLVGSSLLDEPPSAALHDIGFEAAPNSMDAIIVRIRLFANLKAPPATHYVVAGRLV